MTSKIKASLKVLLRSRGRLPKVPDTTGPIMQSTVARLLWIVDSMLDGGRRVDAEEVGECGGDFGWRLDSRRLRKLHESDIEVLVLENVRYELVTVVNCSLCCAMARR
jgi:hypothetical protein